MITLDKIETLIRDNYPEVKAGMALYQAIMQAALDSAEQEALYRYETAKEKLEELLRLQSRAPQERYFKALDFIRH